MLLGAACILDYATYRACLAELTDNDGDGVNEVEGDCNDDDAAVFLARRRRATKRMTIATAGWTKRTMLSGRSGTRTAMRTGSGAGRRSSRVSPQQGWSKAVEIATTPTTRRSRRAGAVQRRR